MKAFLVVIFLLAAASSPWAQTNNAKILGPEDIIRRMITSGSYEGHDNKILGGMGDAAAVLVTKVVAGEHLETNEIDSVLTILYASFAGGAKEASNREPRTALFVLQYLDASTKDLKLRGRIADTRKYTLEQYDEHKKD